MGRTLAVVHVAVEVRISATDAGLCIAALMVIAAASSSSITAKVRAKAALAKH